MSITTPHLSIDADATRIVADFEQQSGLKRLQSALLDRGDGAHLVIELGNPTERFYEIANRISDALPLDHPLKGRVILKKVGRKRWLTSPELVLLQRVLSESLTVGRNSVQTDFFARYTRSLFGAEDKILSNGNHLVFGRRGSGKSSLLLFCMLSRNDDSEPCAWLAMQAYEHRADLQTIVEILHELISQLLAYTKDSAPIQRVLNKLNSLKQRGDQLDESEIRKLIPTYRDALSSIVYTRGDIYVFLDDLHLVEASLQPLLLSILYAFSRGNGIYLKCSAIENFTRNWDADKRIGLEIPNDAQVIRLDYNLTDPSKARQHIESIILAHAEYSGVPSLNVVAGADVIARLVWVGAGVPRDAINIFLQAITKAVQRGHRRVSVMSVNMAASDNLDEKMRFVATDSSGGSQDLNQLLTNIRQFCTKEKRTNAFLVKIENDNSEYRKILKLVDLRLLHVLNQGITPGEAAEKYIALVLDYGFYVSMRSARSMNLFQKGLETPTYRQLRKLPPFKLAEPK